MIQVLRLRFPDLVRPGQYCLDPDLRPDLLRLRLPDLRLVDRDHRQVDHHSRDR